MTSSGAPDIHVRAHRRRPATWAGYLVLALVVCELIARRYISGPLDLMRHVDDPLLLYQLKPVDLASDGYLLRTKVVHYHVDDAGCRVGAEGIAAPRGGSLLFLGGSITFGLGVEAEQGFAHLVGEALARSDPALFTDQTNCSVPGYNLVQTLRSAEIEALALKPRLTVVAVHPSHFMTALDWTRMTPSNAAIRLLAAQLRVARLLHIAWLAKWSGAPAAEPLGSAAVTAALDRFVDATQGAHGARTPVLFVMLGPTLRPDLDFEAELDKRGLPWRRVELPPQTPEFHLDEVHLTDRGNHVVADELTAPVRAALMEAAIHGRPTELAPASSATAP